MQILAVNKDSKVGKVVSGEIAKRLEKTQPEANDFYLMVFGPRSTKPALKKVSIKIVEKRRPTYTLLDENGDEVEV